MTQNTTTWREENITIEAGECYTVSYLQTKPNMFYLQNPNMTKLHVGISKLPTEKTYEFSIPENSSQAFGRPVGTQYLYIFNAGNLPASVKVFSIEDKFDLSILDNINLNVDGITVDVAGDIAIKGFKEGVKLPSGDNTIGKVEAGADTLAVLNTITERLGNLKSDSASIKNNQIDCADNTRDMLWEMQAKQAYNDSPRHLLTEMTEGILAIKEGGIATTIAGDVIVDVDSFYKESSVDKMIPLSKYSVALTYNSTSNSVIASFSLGADSHKTSDLFVKLEETASKTTKQFTEFTSSGSAVFFLYTTEENNGKYKVNLYLNSSSSEPYAILDAVKIDNYIYTHLETMLKNGNLIAMIKNVYSASGEALKSSILSLRYIVTDIGGFLGNYKRIKNYYSPASLTIGSKTTTTISDAFSCEEVPVKIMDKITLLTVSSMATVKIFYTFSDYIEFFVYNTSPIRDLEMPVYAIQISNNSGADITAAVLGGLY